MDDADRAKDIEMGQRKAALLAQQERAKETEQPMVIEGVRLCLDCYVDIPVARLEVRPESVRCVSCKSIKEQKEKQRR